MSVSRLHDKRRTVKGILALRRQFPPQGGFQLRSPGHAESCRSESLTQLNRLCRRRTPACAGFGRLSEPLLFPRLPADFFEEEEVDQQTIQNIVVDSQAVKE